MQKLRYLLVVLGMLLSPMAYSEVRVSIGINLSSYPELVVVPGYPVYYAPRLGANFFFYDGMYWVYQDDNWYASSWYNGPWWLVAPEGVPLFILRVPVRYYRQPPSFFLGWRSDAPPRWGDHWGHEWEQRRGGWDRWNRESAPAAAPLPRYQGQYSGDRYPRQVEQQHELQQRHYSYQPRDPEVRQRAQEQVAPQPSAQQRFPQQERQRSPDDRGSRQLDVQRNSPTRQDGPVAPQQGRPEIRDQKPQPMPRIENREQAVPVDRGSRQQGRPEVQERRQQLQPEAVQRQQQIQAPQGRGQRQQDGDSPREPKQGHDQERGRDH